MTVLALPPSLSGYPWTNLEFDLLELGADASVRVRLPGDPDFQGLHHLSDLWDEADDDRETVVIKSGPLSFQIDGSQSFPLGGQVRLEIGYRSGRPIANLFADSNPQASFADGFWRTPLDRQARGRLLLLGHPQLFADGLWQPAVPGRRSRISPLAERAFA